MFLYAYIFSPNFINYQWAFSERKTGGKGPFINYIRVSREGGVEKSLHTLTLGGQKSNTFLRNILQVDILYQKSRGRVVWLGLCFIYLI